MKENKLVESGDVYKGTHSGWYSISDECFYSQTQVQKDAESGKMVAVETGNEVVWEEEENWKFRLNSFREKLLDWVKKPDCKSQPHPLLLSFPYELCESELTLSRIAGKYARVRRFSYGERRRAIHLPTQEQSQVGRASTWRRSTNHLRLGRRVD